ncbi:cytochrome c oxidase subunit I [Acidimicrobiia bacterium EGI L10123]|uniref:cytochrome c oxidase subunit I n=1 Tax=Salinilacustrithrix flava TaxID=2957203 RepID=UPI003D7C2E94|nr:cytochrome c oxidase subunit I [Acidimicrobiia bacterium EGI L10123]
MTAADVDTGRAQPAERLTSAWQAPPGLPGWLMAVNHKQIGRRFVFTALGFLLVGGLQSMFMRWQLGGPEQDVLSPDAYNALFTMHGTTMMFLFAVPILEGLGMYLVPLMVGARDLPFPRLNAFGYWLYVFGGFILYWSFVTGSVPDGGWFAYTPLAGPEYSPGSNLDFWLLGVTLVEISGILGALELVIVILRHRAPGMALHRMPLFAWSQLVMSAMILFAFPAVVVASLLLEVERKTGAPFYDPDGGGNPLLWQHLFWIFGHPEVYIMLLPATGVISAIVPVFSRRPIIGYAAIVISQVAIAVLSFGLWVHHMFTTGLPPLVLAFFAVSSALIAIPSGVQVFAWLATLRFGRPRWETPLLFIAGFIVIFTLGGITGVMVAAFPFDAQVHDSYFVVAHFHYVLIGGVVFPLFAGLHHWWPKLVGRQPSESLGKVAFWTMFVGFNVAFFPQHILGLRGMPRRFYTYPDEYGWGALNLLSTLGAFAFAAGVLVFVTNLVRTARSGPEAVDDPWGGDTLEWATSSPPPPYNFAVPPVVTSAQPLWNPAPAGADPTAEAVLARLADPPAGVREQPITTAVDGRFRGVALLPGPSYWPLVTALAMAVAMVGVLVDNVPLVVVGASGTLAAIVGWVRPEAGTVGMRRHELGDVLDGRRSTGVWGAAAGAAVLAVLLAYFCYAHLYLAVSVETWPPEGTPPLPALRPAVLVGIICLAAAASVRAGRPRHRGADRLPGAGLLGLGAGVGVLALAGGASMLADLGLSGTERAHDASLLVLHAFVGVIALAGVGINAFAAYQAARLGDHPWVSAAAAISATWWTVIALSWAAVAGVVYGWPQLLGSGG